MEPKIKVQPSAQKNMKKTGVIHVCGTFCWRKETVFIFIYIDIYIYMYIEYLNPYDPHMAYVPLHLVDFYAKCR